MRKVQTHLDVLLQHLLPSVPDVADQHNRLVLIDVGQEIHGLYEVDSVVVGEIELHAEILPILVLLLRILLTPIELPMLALVDDVEFIAGLHIFLAELNLFIRSEKLLDPLVVIHKRVLNHVLIATLLED
jgi:hypothetical protein